MTSAVVGPGRGFGARATIILSGRDRGLEPRTLVAGLESIALIGHPVARAHWSSSRRRSGVVEGGDDERHKDAAASGDIGAGLRRAWRRYPTQAAGPAPGGLSILPWLVCSLCVATRRAGLDVCGTGNGGCMSRTGVIQGLIVAMATLLSGCTHPPPISAPSGVELTPLRTVSRNEAQTLLSLAGVKGVPVRYDVDCYRMKYSALGPHGESVQLSGLLALPRGIAPRRLVSFQHGTTTTRDAVPSQPDQTGLAAAIAFGGSGYALIAPDYPGLGASTGRHPYYVADAVGPAIAAMIDAAERIPGVPKAPVFLSGFSEGGWASLAAVRVLEARGESVLGSAQVAGAYDLRRVSLPAAMKGAAPQHALYLAYLAWAYADRYDHRLDSLLTPEYAAIVERLFSGGSTPDEIVKGLPANPRKLFNQAFLDAYDHDGSHWFLDAVAANSLIDAAPRAPLRLYYGSRDMDVAPGESRGAAQTMHARGADVVAVDVGAVGHDASMLAAAPRILAWLGALDIAAK